MLLYKQNKYSGFSLVETIIYISLMTVILFSLVSLILSASSTYLILKSSRNIERSAINIVNSLNNQVSVSSKIDIPNTIFDNNAGSMALISYGDNGISTTTKIYLSNNQVILSQNNVVVGPLNTSDSSVTKLIFRNMSTSTLNGFKFEMTIDNGTSSEKHMSENFYNSYILR